MDFDTALDILLDPANWKTHGYVGNGFRCQASLERSASGAKIFIPVFDDQPALCPEHGIWARYGMTVSVYSAAFNIVHGLRYMTNYLCEEHFRQLILGETTFHPEIEALHELLEVLNERP